MDILTRNQRGPGEQGPTPVEGRKQSYPPANLLAHDTRNWLTVLQMYCDLLQTCGAADVRYRDWIDELAAAVVRGQGLVTSLLDSVQSRETATSQNTCLNDATAARNPRMAGQTQAHATNLASAMVSRLPMLQKLAGEKVRVDLAIETETAEVNLSEEDFDRILHNLAVNAIEAMPCGGELRIALSALHVEGSGASGEASKLVLLRVSDTGMGISPSLLSSIFQPGVSGKKRAAKDAKERGLGLAVVRDLTVRAGGSVRVSSQGGNGASFEIELPAAHPARSARAQFPNPLLRDRRGAQLRDREPADSPRQAKPMLERRTGTHGDRCGERQSGDLTPKLAVRKKA